MTSSIQDVMSCVKNVDGKNLKLLQRVDDSIVEILTTIPFAVIYVLEESNNGMVWNKLEVEGPLFVVKTVVKSGFLFKIIIMNRLSRTLFQRTLPASEGSFDLSIPLFVAVREENQNVFGIWMSEEDSKALLQRALLQLFEKSSPVSTLAPITVPNAYFSLDKKFASPLKKNANVKSLHVPQTLNSKKLLTPDEVIAAPSLNRQSTSVSRISTDVNLVSQNSSSVPFFPELSQRKSAFELEYLKLKREMILLKQENEILRSTLRENE